MAPKTIIASLAMKKAAWLLLAYSSISICQCECRDRNGGSRLNSQLRVYHPFPTVIAINGENAHAE